MEELAKVDKRTKAYKELQSPDADVKSGRDVRYVQMHDAFTPLQLAPIMSLGIEGLKAMSSLKEGEIGIEVKHPKGREFVVPYGNISFYEINLNLTES